jgi:hypothetical protein
VGKVTQVITTCSPGDKILQSQYGYLYRTKSGLTTHSTRRLDSMAFMLVWFLHLECFMLGAG